MLRDAAALDLVERARSGDAGALERLLAATRPNLERYARRHCESEDVEEAIQDALWVLYRKVGALRSVAAFTSWLVQVVRRACLRYARRRRRAVPLDEVRGWDEHDRTATDADLRARLSLVLADLPARYREVLLLRDVQGLSSEEAATSLGISVDAAKSRLHRARAIVRDAIGAGA